MITTSIMTADTTMTQHELQQYVDDSLNDITRYLKIQDIYGLYGKQTPYHLTKIAILATPLFHQEINLSTWIIQVQLANNLKIFSYNYTISALNSSDLFSHQLWSQLSSHHFGIISIQDNDDSLIKYHSLSDPSDMIFFTINVSDLLIHNGEEIQLFLTPEIGVKRSFTFKVPMSTKQLVKLW